MTFAFYSPTLMGVMSMHFTQQGAVRRINEHRICMNFMLSNGWHISFLEGDCRTSLPLKLTFADADKIREMYERFGSERTLADRAAVEHGIRLAAAPFGFASLPSSMLGSSAVESWCSHRSQRPHSRCFLAVLNEPVSVSSA